MRSESNGRNRGRRLLGGVLWVALAAGACAPRAAYMLPPIEPTAATSGVGSQPVSSPTNTTATTPRKGIIVPGDPSSGTTRLGPGSGDLETSTGTNGSRVNPGSSEGK